MRNGFWAHFWIEFGRGSTTKEETYEFLKYSDGYKEDDEKILEILSNDWCKYQVHSWKYERYEYGHEVVEKPPTEWLEKELSKTRKEQEKLMLHEKLIKSELGLTLHSMEEYKMQDKIQETLRKIGLFGIGIVTITQEKIEEVTQDLIEKGDLNREDGKDFVKEVLQVKEKQLKELGCLLNQKVKETVENRFATQKDVDEIKKRLKEVELASGISTEKISNVKDASNAALQYLARKGIAVFSHEVQTIFRKKSDWYVVINSKVFTGIVIVKPSGEIVQSIESD